MLLQLRCHNYHENENLDSWKWVLKTCLFESLRFLKLLSSFRRYCLHGRYGHRNCSCMFVDPIKIERKSYSKFYLKIRMKQLNGLRITARVRLIQHLQQME